MTNFIMLSKIPKYQQTEELCITAVNKNGNLLRYVKNQTPKICLAAVKENGEALQYVKRQTHEICLAAVKQDGRSLQFVIKQTPEICLAAVSDDGYALEFVKQQTPEICLAAVRQDGLSIQFVEKYDKELCLEAIKNNGHALEFIKEQTPEMCVLAVKFDGNTLQYVQNQTPEICLEAFRNGLTYYYDSEFFNDEILLTILNNNSYTTFDDIQEFNENNVSGVIFTNLCQAYETLTDNNSKKNDKDNARLRLKMFNKNKLAFCSELLSEQSLEYLINLKNKIPEIFEQNIEFSSIYERLLLNQTINDKINKDQKVKIKKF